MVNDNTTVFQSVETSDKVIDSAVMHAVSTMDRVGYSGINQLAGYIISGDPTYITAKDSCRIEIKRIDRYKMLERIIKKYVDTLTEENTVSNEEET